MAGVPHLNRSVLPRPRGPPGHELDVVPAHGDSPRGRRCGGRGRLPAGRSDRPAHAPPGGDALSGARRPADHLVPRVRRRGFIVYGVFGSVSTVSGLTFSAILTLAATLALQTTIGNVIAGFILLRNRVLRIDDRIAIGGVSGRVVQLGLVTVWLRLEDGSLVSVSNSNLLSGPLVNRSAGDRLQGEFGPRGGR